MRQQHLAFELIVVERRADLVALQLAVLVAADAEGGAIRLDEAGKRRAARANVERVPARVEADAAFFDDGDAVLHVGVAVAGADVGVLAGPGAAEAGGARCATAEFSTSPSGVE